MLPQEYTTKKIIPTLRALLSHRLKEKGFSQQKIAEILLVSQPMINKYLKYPESELLEMLMKEEIHHDIIEYTVNNLIMLIDEKKDIKIELASASNLLTFESKFCRKNRELCEQTLLLSQKAEISLVRRFINIIIDLPGVENLIPEVGSNIVFDPFGEKDPKKMIAIDGRLVKGSRGVYMAGDIKIGGSRHTARILSSLQNLCPELQVVFVLSNKKGIKNSMKKCKFKFIETGPHSSNESIEKSIINEIRSKLKGCSIDAILDKGGKGLEPVGYLFEKSLEGLLKKLACLITNFKPI